MAAVTKQLGIHIPHQTMKRHSMHGITDSISFTNYQIVVPCEAINRPKAYQTETYNVVEIYLVC